MRIKYRIWVLKTGKKNSILSNVLFRANIHHTKYQMMESILGIDRAGHRVLQGVYGNGESNIISFSHLSTKTTSMSNNNGIDK